MNLQEMQKPAPKQASPQQQEQFDLILGRARQLMAETGPAWVSAMRKDPVMAAVKMGVQTVREIAKMSNDAGVPVDPVVLIHVGLTLIKDIAGLANDGGIIPDDGLEGYIQEVTQLSIAEYMRLDADEGLLDKAMQEGKKQPAAPGGEGESEQEEQEEPEEMEGPESEEDAMASELELLRKSKGGMQ